MAHALIGSRESVDHFEDTLRPRCSFRFQRWGYFVEKLS